MGQLSVAYRVPKSSPAKAWIRFTLICFVTLMACSAMGFFIYVFPREETKEQRLSLLGDQINYNLKGEDPFPYQRDNPPIYVRKKEVFLKLFSIADQNDIQVYPRDRIVYWYTIENIPFRYSETYHSSFWYEVKGPHRIEGGTLIFATSRSLVLYALSTWGVLALFATILYSLLLRADVKYILIPWKHPK